MRHAMPLMRTSCSYPCFRADKKASSKKSKHTKRLKLVFFDMDGVLLDTVSSWKSIHEHFGTTNQRSIMPYLRGDIDYLEFIRRDVSLWKTNGKAVSKATIEKILYSIPYISGVKECFSYLKTHDIQTAIVSAGLDILAEKVAADIGIDYVFANEVLVGADGRLTGEGVLHVELMQKDKNVRELVHKLRVPLDACAGVGNSCFDIPMLEVCGLGIAFNPEDSCIVQCADVVVQEKDLSKLIPVFQRSR
jgi:phosphoserine phosphatase